MSGRYIVYETQSKKIQSDNQPKYIILNKMFGRIKIAIPNPTNQEEVSYPVRFEKQ
jgi:hypothetical protein